MKKSIAFFDFDGTITTHDTLLEFIKFCSGSVNFYKGFLINSPYLVAYKLKIISNQQAKEKVLSYFFRDMPLALFQEKCDAFAATELARLIRPKALQEIRQLIADGSEVIIVSASPENWLRNWTKEVGASLIATRLEVKDQKLTGRIIDKNCHGTEKVRRIQSQYKLGDYASIAAYGDTSGDKPMLALASKSYYKPFRD